MNKTAQSARQVQNKPLRQFTGAGLCLLIFLGVALTVFWGGAARAQNMDMEYSFQLTENTLRVGFWDGWAPFSYIDGGSARPAGMLVDIWDKWSRVAGIKVEYIAMDSEEVFNALRMGQIDVVMGAPGAHGYVHDLTFGPSLGGISARIYYRSSEQAAELSLEDALKLAPLGVVRGSSFIPLVAQHFPGLGLQIYPSAEAVVQACLNGEIEAFIAWRLCAESFPELAANGIKNTRPLFSQIIHPLMLNTRPGLVKLVNDNFNTIGKTEISSIRASWDKSASQAEEKASYWPYFLFIFLMLALCIIVGRGVVTNSKTYKEMYSSQRKERKLLDILKALSGKYFLITLSDEGEILEVSPEVRTILGYPPEEMLGPLEAFLAHVPNNSGGIFSNGRWDFNHPDALLTLMHKNGTSRQLLFLFSPEGCGEGNSADVCGLVLDCSAYRQLAEVPDSTQPQRKH